MDPMMTDLSYSNLFVAREWFLNIFFINGFVSVGGSFECY